MQDILIDFDVFKVLTSKRLNENHSYNDVLRELLGLDSLIEPSSPADLLLEGDGSLPRGLGAGIFAARGFSCRDLLLPNGTLLKAIYKQKLYSAKIESGQWISESGTTHTSPSSAAREVTGTSVNGLRFWQAKRPSDLLWYRLDLLR